MAHHRLPQAGGPNSFIDPTRFLQAIASVYFRAAAGWFMFEQINRNVTLRSCPVKTLSLCLSPNGSAEQRDRSPAGTGEAPRPSAQRSIRQPRGSGSGEEATPQVHRRAAERAGRENESVLGETQEGRQVGSTLAGSQTDLAALAVSLKRCTAPSI